LTEKEKKNARFIRYEWAKDQGHVLKESESIACGVAVIKDMKSDCVRLLNFRYGNIVSVDDLNNVFLFRKS
jgi:hypothetical protein